MTGPAEQAPAAEVDAGTPSVHGDQARRWHDAEHTAALASRVAGDRRLAGELYAAGVAGFVDELNGQPVRDELRGFVAAAATIRLATGFVSRAYQQSQPLDRLDQPPPADVAAAVRAVADLTAAAGFIVSELRATLAHALLHAEPGTYTAPPGADPLAELRLAAGDLYEVEGSLNRAAIDLAEPAHRLDRLAE